MLGRNHVALSLATVLPFLIPLMFLENKNFLVYALAFLLSVLIGSLLPDSDCGGKPKLYYDFQIIYFLMLPINWLVVRLFNLSKIKSKLKLQYEVFNEHRGIMHSPIGIFISSLLISILLVLIMVVMKSFSILTLLAVFFGLLIGQFLHLLEDSCTVAGINWAFPFGTKQLNGTIFTFEGKEVNKKDIRSLYYKYPLYAISLLLLLGYAFKKISISLTLLYLILIVALAIIWGIIIFVSKRPRDSYLRNIEEIKKLKSFERKFARGKWAKNLEKDISKF